MKIAPLDLRQARFGAAFGGFNRTEVASFLREAADGYERALRDTDRLKQEIAALQQQLDDHRGREATLRDTLLTAQRVSSQVKDTAKTEADTIIRDARSRADDLLRQARARRDGVEREITDLGRRQIDVEASIEGSIAALQHALDFVRRQNREAGQSPKVRQHRARKTEPPTEGPTAVIQAVDTPPPA